MNGLSELQRAQAASVIEYVGRELGVPAEAFTGCRRRAKEALARHVAMVVLYESLRWTMVDIGLAFGRDHSTVHHGIYRVRNLSRSDQEIASIVERGERLRDVELAPARDLSEVLAAARAVEAAIAGLYQRVTLPELVQRVEAVGELAGRLQHAIAGTEAPVPITRVRQRVG